MTDTPEGPLQGGKTAGRRLRRGSILKLAVSAAAIALLLRQVDDRAMAAALMGAQLAPLGGALLVYLVGQVLTAWRWEVIANASGFKESLRTIVAWYFIGMFFNLFGPSTLGGDVVRSLYLGRPTGRRTLALHTVVFDRLSGLMMLVAVATTAFLFFGAFGLPRPVVWATVVFGAALPIAWWLVPALAGRFLPNGNRVRRLVEGDLRRFWTDRWLLTQVAGISVIFHGVQIGAAMLVGSAVGLDVPPTYYFIFHPLVSIFSALPVSVAGLGVREVGYVWFLSALRSVSRETAAAFALLWLAVLLAASAVGGVVFLVYGGGKPPIPIGRADAGVTQRTP